MNISKHNLERLQRLNKRKEWLEKRIKENTEKDLTFDRAELSALKWGIGVIERHFILCKIEIKGLLDKT